MLGFAGPTSVRPDTFFPITGEMTFDIVDVRELFEDDLAFGTNSYDNLILHEMIHTLGFGTTWEISGLITNVGSDAVPDYRFTGEQARDEYEKLYPTQFAADPNSGLGVAVESDEGGEGTIGGHWDEETFTTELLTGFLSSDGSDEVTNLTIAALDDMGYETTYTPTPDIVCFVRGTKISTDLTQMSVEDLSVGDMVETLDHGLQKIRWIGSRTLDAIDLTRAPHLAPIKISAGVLGHGTPHRDLYVSPQHRMLISSDLANAMFDSAEVLIAAKCLLVLDGVEVAQTDSVEYFHILFDDHQVILANGAPSESLYTGAKALEYLPKKSVAEIFELFPDLADADAVPVAARPLIERGRDVKSLLNKHVKSNTPLVNSPYS